MSILARGKGRLERGQSNGSMTHRQASESGLGSGQRNLSELTRILQAASGNERLVSAELLPLVYDELRNLARQRMSQDAAGQTLQPTALVHEAWLKLSGDEERSWSDRAHFFRAAAQAMRHILVDRARAKASLKRGGGSGTADIQWIEVADASLDDRILLVDEVMSRLETTDPESARVSSLKFFGGLTNKEIAAMDGIAERTVERHWAYARAKLFQMIQTELEEEPRDGSAS